MNYKYLMPVGITGAVLLHHGQHPSFVTVNVVVQFVAHLLAKPLAVSRNGILTDQSNAVLLLQEHHGSI